MLYHCAEFVMEDPPKSSCSIYKEKDQTPLNHGQVQPKVQDNSKLDHKVETSLKEEGRVSSYKF